MVKAKIIGETEYRDAYLEELVREIVDEPPVPGENTSESFYLERTMHHYDNDTSNDPQNFQQPEKRNDIFTCFVYDEVVIDVGTRFEEISTERKTIVWRIN